LLFLYIEIFTKTIKLSCNYAIKTRIKKIKNNLERIIIDNIDIYWYFKKLFNLSTTNFILDLSTINKTIAKLLESIKNIDLNQSFFDINKIIRNLQTNNQVQYSTFKVFESIAKLIDNNIDLLDVNKSRIVKAKERFVEAKNKKKTITRTKKTKTKSTRRNLFDFEHVNAIIKILRNSKCTIERNAKDNRNQARSKKQKKIKIDNIAAINTNISTFNKNINKIYNNIRDIITRQATRKTVEKTITIFAIFAIFAIIIAIIKKIILINNNSEFNANNNNNIDSNNNWIYNYS